MIHRWTTLLFLIGLFFGCQPAEKPPEQPSPLTSAQAASQHLDAGLTFVESRDYEKALIEFTKAIELQPSVQAYSNRGLIYSGLGEYEKSLADHNKAVELDPTDSTNYYNRSLHFSATGELDKALADLKESIRLEPTFHAAFTARGEICQEKAEYERALNDFRQAILLAPDHFLAHNDMAWLLATCPDDNLRNGRKALEHSKQACELSGWRWETVDTLAAAWAEVGEFEKAANAQERAIMAAPGERRAEMEARLKFYRQGKPFRLPAPRPSTGLLSDLNTDAVAILKSIPGTQLNIERSGPDSKPSHRIIHIADFHFVEKAKYTADLRDLREDPITDDEIEERYQELLTSVEAVQAEQAVVFRYLIQKQGLEEVHIEGLSKEKHEVFTNRIFAFRNLDDQLKRLQVQAKDLEAEDEPDEASTLILSEVERLRDEAATELLRMGIATQFLVSGELERILPLEDETAYRSANPLSEDGTVSFDEAKNKAREDAQVRLLLDGGPFSVIVLGGAHDLADNVERLSDGKAEYVRVEGKMWKEVAGVVK